jgi:thiamine-phosphate pyrophosphorylase
MTDPRRIHGIYGILPAALPDAELLAKAGAALRGGIRTLQLRDKKHGYKDALKRAGKLVRLAHDHGARLIVNDSLQLAAESGADGVHLGRSDVQDIAAMRTGAGPLLIGISCKGDAAFARHALEQGADYVSFGAVFPTASKQDAVVIGLPRLAKARQMFPGANICAIGGITVEALPAVRRAGADCAAVIAALFDGSDVETKAHEMVEAWNNAASA